jgi:hypothetical protein
MQLSFALVAHAAVSRRPHNSRHALDVLGGDAAWLLMLDALGLHAHAAIGTTDIGHAFYKRRIAAASDQWWRGRYRFGIARD